MSFTDCNDTDPFTAFLSILDYLKITKIGSFTFSNGLIPIDVLGSCQVLPYNRGWQGVRLTVSFITVLALCLVVGACGNRTADDVGLRFTPVTTQRPDHLVEPALQPLVDSYLVDLTASGLIPRYDTQRVEFGDTDPNSLGFCQLLGVVDSRGNITDSWRVIVIDKTLNPTSAVTRAVVYHELTHCSFGINHSKTPGTAMYPILSTDEKFWKATWSTRLRELMEDIKASLEK